PTSTELGCQRRPGDKRSRLTRLRSVAGPPAVAVVAPAVGGVLEQRAKPVIGDLARRSSALQFPDAVRQMARSSVVKSATAGRIFQSTRLTRSSDRIRPERGSALLRSAACPFICSEKHEKKHAGDCKTLIRRPVRGGAAAISPCLQSGQP